MENWQNPPLSGFAVRYSVSSPAGVPGFGHLSQNQGNKAMRIMGKCDQSIHYERPGHKM
jgi:hypothetical protein